MTVSQYLARLAAEATTAINAKDFGHAIYDLSVRRSLIRVGQEMIDVAYDAPVDFAPPLHLTPQNDQLMSERRILCFKPALQLAWRGYENKE